MIHELYNTHLLVTDLNVHSQEQRETEAVYRNLPEAKHITPTFIIGSGSDSWMEKGRQILRGMFRR